MRRRSFITGLAAGVAASGCLGDADTGGDDTGEGRLDAGGSWRQFQGNAGKTGASSAPGPVDGARVAWWNDTWGQGTGPLVDDGLAIVGSGLRHPTVSAYDLATGKKSWSHFLGDHPQRSMALEDDTVYVSARNIYAIDIKEGEQEWRSRVNSVRGLTLADGAIITATDRAGRTIAINADDGEERWEREYHVLAAPGADEEHAYVSGSSVLVALDLDSGDTVWEEEIPQSRRSPTVGYKRVYIPTQAGVTAFAAATGEEEWTIDGWFSGCDPALADDSLYLAGRRDGADEPAILAVDPADGGTEWIVPDAALADASIVAGPDCVYVASGHRLLALDPDDGTTLWWLEFQWTVECPAVVGEHLLVPVGGRLLALAPGEVRDGRWEADATPRPNRSVSPPEPDYATHDFSFGSFGYDVAVEDSVSASDAAPVTASFSVEGDRVTDDESVEFGLAIENEGAGPLQYSTGAPAPFGLFTLMSDERRITPWTAAYEKSRHVHTQPHRGVTGVNSIAIPSEIEPGGTVEDTYELSMATHRIGPGTYQFSESVRLREDGADEEWTVGFEATVEVTEREDEAGDRLADIAIADVAEPPEEFQMAFAVEALAPMTETHPGLLEVRIKNPTDERVSLGSLREYPFGAYLGIGPSADRLVLLSDDMYAPGLIEQRGDGWWEPTVLPHAHARSGRSQRSIDPGETWSNRFVVLAHPDTDSPNPGDTFAFEHGFADENVDVTLGFALAVQDP